MARYLKKNNIITIIEKPQPLIVSVAGGQQTVVEKRGSKLVSYTEPSITSKYKPIVQQFVILGENNKEENITINRAKPHHYSFSLKTKEGLKSFSIYSDDKAPIAEVLINPGDNLKLKLTNLCDNQYIIENPKKYLEGEKIFQISFKNIVEINGEKF